MDLCADLVNYLIKLCCNVVLLFWKLSLYCVASLCYNLFCCSFASNVKCLLVCPASFNKIHVDVMNVICFNLKNYDIEFMLMWWINHEFIYLFIFCRPTCFVACARLCCGFGRRHEHFFNDCYKDITLFCCQYFSFVYLLNS